MVIFTIYYQSMKVYYQKMSNINLIKKHFKSAFEGVNVSIDFGNGNEPFEKEILSQRLHQQP